MPYDCGNVALWASESWIKKSFAGTNEQLKNSETQNGTTRRAVTGHISLAQTPTTGAIPGTLQDLSALGNPIQQGHFDAFPLDMVLLLAEGPLPPPPFVNRGNMFPRMCGLLLMQPTGWVVLGLI